MIQALGRMGERSVQQTGVDNRGCTQGKGKRERERAHCKTKGTVEVLIAPKAARRQDRRLARCDEGGDGFPGNDFTKELPLIPDHHGLALRQTIRLGPWRPRGSTKFTLSEMARNLSTIMKGEDILGPHNLD
jgi:hypothetical protein